jgi:hypothetical protein
MSFRVDIGLPRMWIFSFMQFEVGILIARISVGRMIRSYARWRGCRRAYCWRMMDDRVLRDVPLLILRRNEMSGICILDDKRMDDGRF